MFADMVSSKSNFVKQTSSKEDSISEITEIMSQIQKNVNKDGDNTTVLRLTKPHRSKSTQDGIPASVKNSVNKARR